MAVVAVAVVAGGALPYCREWHAHDFHSFKASASAPLHASCPMPHAAGLLTGLVVDSGDGVGGAVAVVEGYVQPRATQRLNVAGRHVTARLLELLQR